jgi:uncharacterized metal-binding protein YceD (DUF177 family)
MTSPDPVPEFSHAIPLSEIGGKMVRHRLAASDGERAALATRFGLLSLDCLTADVDLALEDAAIIASGRLHAKLTQPCVASGVPVPAQLDETFMVRFIAEIDFHPDVEIELDEGECDTLFHDGRKIDLGEIVAQTLGLAMNPYPRSPDADSALRAAGVKDEDEAGPFAALAALRKGSDTNV